jgi:hypothetical protein
VVLFHLRGRKRLFVYPPDDAHLPQSGMEQTIMRTTTEELPYNRGMDANAWTVDLEAGQALTWPLYAPHRVENLGEFNVSLSLDFQTWDTRLTRGAHFANGVLRGWGVTPVPMHRTPMAARAALWACSLAMKKANLVWQVILGLSRYPFFNHRTRRTHGNESSHCYALLPCIRCIPWFPDLRRPMVAVSYASAGQARR